MVVLPPGGNGMISVIGRAGKSCARRRDGFGQYRRRRAGHECASADVRHLKLLRRFPRRPTWGLSPVPGYCRAFRVIDKCLFRLGAAANGLVGVAPSPKSRRRAIRVIRNRFMKGLGSSRDGARTPELPGALRRNGKKSSQMRSSRTSASWSGNTVETAAVAPQQAEPLELCQRVVAFEIDVGAECLPQPVLDPPVELVAGRPVARREQEIVGQESFLAFLLLGGADDVVEDAGVVVDVAVVDVVGQRSSGAAATGAGISSIA